MVNSYRVLTSVCFFFSLLLFATSVVAADLQSEEYNSIGINLLRQKDPNLTGKNTTVALICRSITYIDGEPQNDYKPDISHRCFNETKFTLHNDLEPPAGISEHSTAICSILFGKDSDNGEQSSQALNYQGLICDSNAEVFEFSKVEPSLAATKS